MRTDIQKPQLDAIDRQILQAPAAGRRISNVDLVERVHLSPSACLRRVKQLEEAGVIDRYVGAAQCQGTGAARHVLTIINLATMSDALLSAFEQAVRDHPEVLDCYYVAGSNDYLIRFSYRDAEDLERFHTQVLMRLPASSGRTPSWCCAP